MWRLLVIAIAACSARPAPAPTPAPQAAAVGAVDAAASPPATADVATAAATAAATPNPVYPTLPGQPEPTARLRGWGALVIGARVFVIAEDFDAVEAYDPATGRRLWRTKRPAKTSGRHSLHALAGAVALWAGNQMLFFAPATGKLVRAPDTVPWNDHCWLDTDRGLCTMRCECRFHVFNCATGRAVGAVYEQTHVEFHDLDGTSSGGCYGGGGDVVGRAGSAAVFSIEDHPHRKPGTMFSSPLSFVAVEVPSGRERYRTPAAPLTSTVAPASTGVTPDGATCYAGDHNGRLVVWDCVTGAVLWSMPELPATGGLPGHQVQALAAPRGIFRHAGDTSALHDERTGKVIWTRTEPPGRLTLLAGAPPPRMLSIGLPSDIRTTELVWLTPAGTEAATLAIDGSPDDLDDRGLLAWTADSLVALDLTGRELARTTAPLPRNITPFADHLNVFGDDHYALLDRALTIRLRLSGSVASAPGSTLSALALYRWPPRDSNAPGEILLYSLPP